jgi:hypothetical protein
MEDHFPIADACRKYARSKYITRLFDQLQDEFRIASAQPSPQEVSPEARAEAIKIVEEILTKNRCQVATLDDARRAQAALLHLCPMWMLKNKARVIHKEYAALVESEVPINNSHANESTQAESDIEVRSRMIHLFGQTNQHLLARAERWRRRCILSTCNIGVFLFAALCLLMLVHNRESQMGRITAIYVFLTGMIGGVISVQQRVISADASEDRWVRAFSTWLPTFNVVISPIFGGIGAIFFLGVIETNIFATNVLPLLNCPKNSNPLLCFVVAEPATSIDAAKLFILSVFAGFSERLVPDLLDLLGNNVIKARLKT